MEKQTNGSSSDLLPSDECFQKARRMLDDTPQLLDHIMKSMGDGLSIQDRNMRIVYQNKFMEDTFGAHIGKYCYRIYEKRDHVCVGCPIVESFRTGNVTKALRVGIAKDGTPYRFENIASLLRNNQGEIVAGIELCRIVEDRERAIDELKSTMEQLNQRYLELQQAETALRESESRLKDIALSTSDWFWEVDTEWRYTYCSDGVQRILGCHPDELIGKTPFDFMPPEEAKAIREMFNQLATKKKPIENFENLNISTKGQRVYLLTNGLAILDQNGNLLGYRGADQDITRRKRMEDDQRKLMDELKRSNAELEQYAFVTSHDLQEPLRKIGSYLELLSYRYNEQLDQDAREFIEYAVDGAQRMKIMINDLLMYSRLGKRDIVFTPVDMNKVFQKVCNDLEIAIRENNAVISCDPLPVVTADGSQLHQLFRNLITNAIKYHGQEPPHIHIWAERQERAWQFCINDNGIGIAPRFFEKIFHVFQRLHPAGRYDGTGIGLAVCKKIVEFHGGKIWLASTPEQGSTFYFTIPDAKEER
ncbi:PAS domain S-box protein [bacterium]|nr:PAS domain S-box protein [bacterium]